ncbi:hypothetical protein DFH09DRAFT_1301599 [Mycena vulgaris]|nr:hypothetical protein DFH09DRAFT_1301599 [Mycena vulgaris]
MDTPIDVLDTNLTRTHLTNVSDTDNSDVETDDSMPDLIPASPVLAPVAAPTAAANAVENSHNADPAAVLQAGVTTLIQHIGLLNITGSISNEPHPEPGRLQPLSADHCEADPVPTNTSSNWRHTHITKLRGETRAANNAIHAAVFESIEETWRRQNDNGCNNNHRGYGYHARARAHPSDIVHLFALLERLHRIEVLLRRLERLISLLSAMQL